MSINQLLSSCFLSNSLFHWRPLLHHTSDGKCLLSLSLLSVLQSRVSASFRPQHYPSLKWGTKEQSVTWILDVSPPETWKLLPLGVMLRLYWIQLPLKWYFIIGMWSHALPDNIFLFDKFSDCKGLISLIGNSGGTKEKGSRFLIKEFRQIGIGLRLNNGLSIQYL